MIGVQPGASRRVSSLEGEQADARLASGNRRNTVKSIHARRLQFLALVALLVTTFMLPAAGGTASAAQTPNQTTPFYPRPIADANGDGSFEPFAWLDTSGNWVAYAKQLHGCGHCGT